MLKLAAALAVASMALSPAYAAPCRDEKGKFIKCADKKPVKPKVCRDAKGHFKKC